MNSQWTFKGRRDIHFLKAFEDISGIFLLQVVIFTSFPALTVNVTVKCISRVENKKAIELSEKCP